MKNKASASKNNFTLLILGRSGSGKGTQMRNIALRFKKNKVCVLETGRLLRKFFKKSNPAVKAARFFLNKGIIVPSWLVIYLWLRQIVEGKCVGKNIIFDGSPRKIEEAKLIDEVVSWHQNSIPICLYIEAGERECSRRLLSRGRVDDTKPAINNRMHFFLKEVMPVVRFYEKSGRLIRVNGERSSEFVWKDIDRILSKKLGKIWPRK